jgi:hypothetical protein
MAAGWAAECLLRAPRSTKYAESIRFASIMPAKIVGNIGSDSALGKISMDI